MMMPTMISMIFSYDKFVCCKIVKNICNHDVKYKLKTLSCCRINTYKVMIDIKLIADTTEFSRRCENGFNIFRFVRWPTSWVVAKVPTDNELKDTATGGYDMVSDRPRKITDGVMVKQGEGRTGCGSPIVGGCGATEEQI